MNMMHTLTRLFILLAITVTVLAASNAAFADGKVWQDSKPKITIESDELLNYLVDFDYSVDKNTSGSKYHNGAAMSASAEYGELLINAIYVPEGATLTFNKLVFLDKQKKPLPHCNMILNPDFVAGASEITISISDEGCEIY